MMALIQIYRSGVVASRMKNRRKNISMLPVENPLVLPRGSAQSTASYSEYPRRRRLECMVYGDMIIIMMSTSTGLSGKWMNLRNGSQFDVRDCPSMGGSPGHGQLRQATSRRRCCAHPYRPRRLLLDQSSTCGRQSPVE